MMLIIGSGVAGLSAALAAVEAAEAAGPSVEPVVELVTQGTLARPAEVTEDAAGAFSPEYLLGGGNTALAQGGIAAAIGADDSAADHLADTLTAGVGLVDTEAADVLVREGAEAVRRLIDEGFDADRDSSGAVALGLEGAHGRNRIVHAWGDRTGAALHAHLAARVLTLVGEGRIALREHRHVEELLVSERPGSASRIAGAVLRRTDVAPGAAGELETVTADAVVLATGGYAALYSRTSNQPGARGEGIVCAARAGAVVTDLEFVQFHPTVLHGTGQLVSEAVRGAGAVLVDGAGSRFMVDKHPMAELAPRDVVVRQIHRVLRERGEECVWLDATGIEREGGPGSLAAEFPGIHQAVTERGFDWTREPIPVSPASHYTMGGVLSDLDGRTTVPGLFVAGEVASTGVHGANRLASNSLLEGLVFGPRAARAALGYVADPGAWELHGTGARALAASPVDAVVGVFSGVLVGAASSLPADATDGSGASALAEMIAVSAAARTESRGAHQREDFPEQDPAQGYRRAFAFHFAAPVSASGLNHIAAPTTLTDQRSFAPC